MFLYRISANLNMSDQMQSGFQTGGSYFAYNNSNPSKKNKLRNTSDKERSNSQLFPQINQ